VKWKTIKELGIDMEKIELRYGHHTGRSPARAATHSPARRARWERTGCCVSRVARDPGTRRRLANPPLTAA
jgi:hypothetical protein